MNTEILLLTQKLAKYRTNHVLHLILSVVTLGIWLPLWLIVGISNSIEYARIERQVRKLGQQQ